MITEWEHDMTFKRRAVKTKKAEDRNNNPSKIRPQNKHLVPAKKGQVLNPAGRPKGSRSKFAETFLKDFLEDWETHGATAIAEVRRDDPSTYLRVAASLLPKEFNIKDESQLEKFLEQFSTKELEQFVVGITAVGVRTVVKEDNNTKTIRGKSERVH